jgi:hypothetical protein
MSPLVIKLVTFRLISWRHANCKNTCQIISITDNRTQNDYSNTDFHLSTKCLSSLKELLVCRNSISHCSSGCCAVHRPLLQKCTQTSATENVLSYLQRPVTTFQLLTKFTVQINQVTSYKTFDKYANNCAFYTTGHRPCARRRTA